MTVDFSSVSMEARRKWHIFQVLGEKIVNPEFYIYQKYPSGIKGRRIKIFSDEVKLREFISSRHTLKECLKGVLETERNDKRKNHEIIR